MMSAALLDSDTSPSYSGHGFSASSASVEPIDIEFLWIIQQGLLPSRHQLGKDLDHYAVWFKPKETVSGDFYWTYRRRNKLVVAVGDCSGHGARGGMISLLAQVTLQNIVRNFGPIAPHLLLSELNQRLRTLFNPRFLAAGRSPLYVSVDVGIVTMDLKSRELQFSGANRPLLVLPPNDRPTITIPRSHSSVGGESMFRISEYQLQHYAYEPGTRFAMYTDGLTDQFGGFGKRKYGHSRLLKQMDEAPSQLSEEAIVNNIRHDHERWQDELKQIDDISLLVWRA